jgi:Thioesterase-like superfamily
MGSAPDTGAARASAHPLDADTAVERLGDGAYGATVSDRWNRPLGGPLGGYLMGICLRALCRELPLPDPVVLSAFFLRPAQPGHAEVQTELIRAGRRTATGQASLSQDGKERVRVIATFTDLARACGRTVVLNAPPALPPPDRAIDPLLGLPLEGVSIAQRVEFRTPELPGWRREEPTGRATAELWARLKEPREPDLTSLAVMVDALPLAVLELGEVGTTTLELTVHLRGHPAPGWLACRNLTRHVIGGLHEEDVEIWDSRRRLVAQSRQLATLPPASVESRRQGDRRVSCQSPSMRS